MSHLHSTSSWDIIISHVYHYSNVLFLKRKKKTQQNLSMKGQENIKHFTIELRNFLNAIYENKWSYMILFLA